MAITAAMVKELRERTGAGMMECKRALKEAAGDADAAADLLRKAGAAKADKKAGRIAADGVIAIAEQGKAMAMVEVNCETDFAARNEEFIAYAQAVAERVLASRPTDTAALNELPLANGAASVGESLKELIGKIGENMSVRRFVVVEGDNLGGYLHKAGAVARIGVIVSLQGGDKALAKDVAMHVAASKPLFLNADAVPPQTLAKEKSILLEQAAASGKPPNIVEKMVAGKVAKFIKEITLAGQPFVKDPDTTVEKLLKKNNAQTLSFTRFELGEGMQKKTEDFRAEVRAQARAQAGAAK